MSDTDTPMAAAGLSQLLRFFFSPEGRIARREYALGVGFLFAIDAAAFVAFWNGGVIATAILVPAVILGLPVTVAQLVLVAKRCHDIGLPGTFLLIVVLPFVGLAWLAVLALIPGNRGPNAYGPAPVFARD